MPTAANLLRGHEGGNHLASMDSPTAFVAVALAAVSWDGVLSRAGSRALRHELDYRVPFNAMSDGEMIALFDRLLSEMRAEGAKALAIRAARVLDPHQRCTAFAVAAEIMRSDGELVAEERQILDDLATELAISASDSTKVLEVMDMLHASLEGSAVPA